MIKQFIKDVKWNYLILSVVLAFCILLLLGSLIASFKAHHFTQAFEGGNIVWSQYKSVQEAADKYVNSYYWIPLHIISLIVAQFSSCLFLVKHAKGAELTNGLAHGVFLAFLVYQLDLIGSFLGIVVSLVVAARVKDKRKHAEITVWKT